MYLNILVAGDILLETKYFYFGSLVVKVYL